PNSHDPNVRCLHYIVFTLRPPPPIPSLFPYTTLFRSLFPDNGYGFVSGGDPASIPGLTYKQYVKIYRRHYRPDNCCITLYGKMDMGDKLAFLDRAYLSRMPKGAPRPRTPLQYPQAGIKKEAVYETETPESIPVQCALG